MSGQTIRLFVGIRMPSLVIKEARRVQQLVQSEEIFTGSYDDLAQLHVTLNFIGNVPVSERAAIEEALRGVEIPLMQCTLGPLDIFAEKGAIRILYLHIFCPAFALLVDSINAALMPWKNPESRPFMPHLTLARVKQVPDKKAFLAAIHLIEVERVRCELNSFALIESMPVPGGHEHRDLAVYKAG